MKSFGSLADDADDESPVERKAALSSLGSALRDALAETFMFYFKAHSFHWNVTGSDFPQLHSLFGSIYEDAHDAVDDIAERIRTIGEMAPTSLIELMRAATIKDGSAGTAASMVSALRADNEAVIAALTVAYETAEDADKCGLSNFLQDRLDKHAKWGWQLTATSGR